MSNKPVTLGRMSPEENNDIRKAQVKAGSSSVFIDGVPSLRMLVMALIRAYLNGDLKIRDNV